MSALGPFVLLAGIALAGSACSSSSDTAPSGEDEEGSAAVVESDRGLIYFHGMSGFGFTRAIVTQQSQGADVLTPRLDNVHLTEPPPATVLDFAAAHSKQTIASGYSLGRIPVLHLMKDDAKGVTRVVLLDPTYDSVTNVGEGLSGGITRAWLDGDSKRSFLLVYGDVTRSVAGERSYKTELANHPRASLCYVPGNHERFRQADMAVALQARDCADLKTRLGQ